MVLKIGIVGGGATGLTAGYELVKKGHDVTVFESLAEVGGLVRGIKVGTQLLERFYHHIFTSDNDLINLIEEVGLGADLHWYKPTNAFYTNRHLYPFTTPIDLLLFKELSFSQRIALGLLVYKARLVNDWHQLEQITAKDWLISKAGQAVYDRVWGPLLYFKFDVDAEKISAAWLWNKFKLRGSTRGKGQSRELLGYMTGSFTRVYEKLALEITGRGGQILNQKPVNRIFLNSAQKITVCSNEYQEDFDKVIVTLAPVEFLKLVPDLPSIDRRKLEQIQYKANICMLLQLNQSLSPYYWSSVAQTDLPFVAMVEHTNLVPKDQYDGVILYLSRYLDANDPLFSETDETIQSIFFMGLKQVFPEWEGVKTVRNMVITRARYSQPVIPLNYSQIRPTFQTAIPGLFMANMAQIYPEDRGQNYAIRIGKEVAECVSQKRETSFNNQQSIGKCASSS